MQHLLQFGLSNALAAAVLAVLAAVATRVWRNPHFAYALWFVVLLRLVAPPLLPVGVPVPQWMATVSNDAVSREPSLAVSASEKAAPPSVDGVESVALDELNVAQDTGGPKLPPVAPETNRPELSTRAAARASELVAPSPLPQDRGNPEGAPPRGSSGGSQGVSEDVSKPTASQWPSLANLVAATWLTGTLSYLLLTTLRVRRFSRVLRRARRDVPAGVAAEAAEVADAVGLRRVPRLAFADAALPPMVWPEWRPVVLLPGSLFTSLGAEERRLLLCHEFLHLRRRDHIVRWFEVGVVALYWWNPVAWWAVARLQAAEEDCCDAAVLVAHPHESARYGETLVSVAQFLSTGTLPTPSLSLGVARNHHIKRRLTMILHGPRWPELSKGRLAAFSLLGAALVAVTWTAAKAQTAPASPAASAASPSSSKTEVPAIADSLVKPQGERIDEILFEGNATIPAAAILQKLKTQAGSTATPSQVQEDIRALINTRWFFSVVPSYRRTDKKRTLVFVVVERPTVRSVDFQGAKEIPLNKLAVEAGLKVGSPFSNGANQDAARHLEKFYHEQGYAEATVELIKGDKPDDSDVVFRIHEGVKQRVVGRYFVGNKFVSDEKLAMELKSSPAYVIHGDKFDPVNTTEDVDALRKYYAQLGFFDATVKPTVHRSKDRKSISLEYAVHEGVRYKIRNFGIRSEVPFETEELLRMSRTHQGQFCDGLQIQEELKKLKERYAATGLTPPDVGIQLFFTPEQPGIVDISVRVLHENKNGKSLPSAPVRGSNGDTKQSATSRRSPKAPVSATQDVRLSQIEELQPAPGDDELRKLQKERYNAALRELKLYEYQFEVGTTRISAACQATRKFFEAWKALAQQPADELRAVDWYVGYTNHLWNGARARLMAGGVTGFNPADEAEARATRFEAQIEAMKLHQRSEPSASKTDPHIEYKGEQPQDAPPPPPRESQKQFTYERHDGSAKALKGGRFVPLYLKHPEQMSLLPTDDKEQRQLKENYNAAAQTMDAYQRKWRAGDFDLRGQIENIQAAVLKLRDAELALSPDAESKLGSLGKYLNFLRGLQKFAHTWVNADGSVGATTPLSEARLHEASVGMQLKMAQLLRELAQNEQGKTLPPAGPVVEEPARPSGLEQRRVYASLQPTLLPELLASRTLEVTPQDDARHKSLKEQYNAALRTLQDLHTNPGSDVSVFAVSVTTNARQLLVAELGLARPNEFPRAYERFIELMKYFDSIQIRNPDGSIDVNHIIAIDEARREAELKLLELKRISVHEDQSRGTAVGATAPPTKAAAAKPPRRPLPRLLMGTAIRSFDNDSDRTKLLIKQYFAESSKLQSLVNPGQVPKATANDILFAARRLCVVHDELGRPQNTVDFYEQYVELTKYLESLGSTTQMERLPPDYELKAFRALRVEAEQKLAEVKQAALIAQAQPPFHRTDPAKSKAPIFGPAPVTSQPAPEKVPLPVLLTRQPLDLQANDDERLTLLKKRDNAALRRLQASHAHYKMVPQTATATNVLAAARRVLMADLALISDQNFGKQPGQSPVDARQRYFELMKYLEREAEARFGQGLGGSEELEAAHEARLDAELELLEGKQKLADRDQSRIQSTDAAVVVARAELDVAKATVERRKAELNRQTAHLAFQKIQYDRINRLHEQKAIEARLVTEQRDKRDAASAAVAKAKEAIDAAQSELSIKQVRFDQLAKLSQTK